MRAVVYVRGEKKATTCPQRGRALRGMKTPERKMRGKRMRFKIDITSPTFSVGYEATRVPIEEKQREERNRATTRTTGERIRFPKKRTPMTRGIRAMATL